MKHGKSIYGVFKHWAGNGCKRVATFKTRDEALDDCARRNQDERDPSSGFFFTTDAEEVER